VITPKAPWEPKGQRSILVEDSKIIKVNSTGRIPNTEIYCDGEELLVTDNDQETHIVVKKNLNPITVLIASDYLPERDGKVFGELGFQTGK
jgi:NAD kinase